MKILYGVQGTGNGHISRAREMAKSLDAKNVDVDYLFSGREESQYFDMEAFGKYRCFRGLTFYSRNGRLSYVKTALSNNIFQFFKDVLSLRLDQYDLIVSDFEPVTAWAGKLRNKKVIGMGHQYAFGHTIPRAGDNFVSDLTMRYFAPAKESLGLHWSAFDSPILPPIVDTHLTRDSHSSDAIVVYLPFENQKTIQHMLGSIKDQKFIIYSPELQDSEMGNLSLRKTSHDGFKRDLSQAKAVICNSGFELISECLQLGLAILTKPQLAQTEQMSNAAALAQLGYATTCKELNTENIADWLESIEQQPTIQFPDVAQAITDWILENPRCSPQQLSDKLWSRVQRIDVLGNSENSENFQLGASVAK